MTHLRLKELFSQNIESFLKKLIFYIFDELLRFKIIEKGGAKVKRKLQVSNPLETPGRTDDNCLACRDGRGGGGCFINSNNNNTRVSYPQTIIIQYKFINNNCLNSHCH